jgi:Uma2 family endonuclease
LIDGTLVEKPVGYWEGIISEGNTASEMDRKLAEYFQSGTRLAWIVDPGPRTVAVYHGPGPAIATLAESDALTGGDVLPGLQFPIADIFLNVPRFD